MAPHDEQRSAGDWWRHGVIYQVYPRSFRDSNGDGIGDLEGIRSRLDYFEWLGVDAIWLSPFYRSPMQGFGYDVADYTAVDPIFGTMADFDRLLADAHARGLRVIVDFVPNHSSDQHPWFQDAARSRTSAKRDWYIWADPAPDGGPPNNWLSEFGGAAWTWHEATGQYYYHAFLDSQPDLNWRNPAVREAMTDAMRFWLDKGVDGFRVDVLWHLIKDPLLRDNPPNPDFDPERESGADALLPVWSSDHPEVHEVVALLRRVVDEYDDRLLIGEVYLPIGRLMAYYGLEESGAHLPFNFHLLQTPWNAVHLRALIDEYDASIPRDAWPNWVLGNHDRPRLASRLGAAQARVAAMLLLTLRGTPTLYYGDEIGMKNLPALAPEQIRDPREKNEPGLGLGRDPCRSPMQWQPGPQAGFSDTVPWLPVAPDADRHNVAVERDDPRSMLSLHHALLRLRRGSRALTAGRYRPVNVAPPLLAYERSYGEERLLIVLNLGSEPCRFELPSSWQGARVVLSSLTVNAVDSKASTSLPLDANLDANEGLVLAPQE